MPEKDVDIESGPSVQTEPAIWSYRAESFKLFDGPDSLTAFNTNLKAKGAVGRIRLAIIPGILTESAKNQL